MRDELVEPHGQPRPVRGRSRCRAARPRRASDGRLRAGRAVSARRPPARAPRVRRPRSGQGDMPRRTRNAMARRDVAGPAVGGAPARQGTLVRGGRGAFARARHRSHEHGVYRLQRHPRSRPAGRRPGPHHGAGHTRRRRPRAGRVVSRLAGLARRGHELRGHRGLQRAGHERRRPGHGDRALLRGARHGECLSPARGRAAARPRLLAR